MNSLLNMITKTEKDHSWCKSVQPIPRLEKSESTEVNWL
jgi:hypothetical protein